MKPLSLLAASLLLSCAGVQPIHDQHIVILHTNDLHGRVQAAGPAPGLARLATYLKQARAEAQARGARVLLIDCGDFFQGTPEGDLTEGRLVIECMNAIGYDALCLGNHDFDLGPNIPENLKPLARFPFLGANVVKKGTRDPPPWVTRSILFPDIPLEIVGLVTSEMPNLTMERARAGLSFLLEEETLEHFPWQPNSIRLLATHCGSIRDRELAAQFTDLAAILGGHGHQETCEKVGPVWVMQSLCFGMRVGRLELVIRNGSLISSSARLEKVEPGPEDPDVKRIIDRYSPDIDRVMDEVVGELAQDLPTGTRGTVESSPLGNHLTDIMRAATGTDIAFQNRTGIRAPLRKGIIRLRDIYQVSPFGNTVVTMKMTGVELLTLLEGSLSDGTRLLLEVSGLELTWDPTAEKGKRVVRVTVAGMPLDPGKPYTVATNSFLGGGGDGHTPFRRGTEFKDTLLNLLDLHRAALAKERPLLYATPNRIIAVSR